MSDVISDIKARLSIEDVVSSYVQLKKAGRSYKGLCPFHSEKTPSFIVSPEKQIAYCFGCHKGGDIFKFIEEAEGVEFPEAVKILADKAGIKTDFERLNKKYKAGEKTVKDYLLDVHDEASKYFEESLFDKGEESREVLKYLEKRGIKEETIKEFRIGFAKDDFEGLYNHLTKKGFKKDVLVKSGLFSSKDVGSSSLYDKFRARLMFPIFDQMGRVIAFGGRALKPDQNPKYLNSPDTPLYSKGKVLFGLSHAKKAMKENDKVIVVEGYFDLISLYQVGICNVVASSGTALTPDQVALIKRFTKNIVACFDTDDAGIEATKRAYEVAQGQEIDMKTLKMPVGFKDPADFMLESEASGKDDFLKMVDEASEFIEFYANLLVQKNDIKSLEGRRKFLDEIIPLLKVVKSSVRMDYFVRVVAEVLDTKEKFVYDEIANFKVLRGPTKSEDKEDEAKKGKIDAGSVLIGIFLEYPKFFEFAKNLNKDDFGNDLKDIYIELSDQYNSLRSLVNGKWDLDSEKMVSVSEKVSFLSLFAQSYYEEFSEEAIEVEVEKLIDKIIKNRRLHQRLQLEKALKEADKVGDTEKKKNILEEFNKVISF